MHSKENTLGISKALSHTRLIINTKPAIMEKIKIIIYKKIKKPALLRNTSSHKRTSPSGEKTLKMEYPQPDIIKHQYGKNFLIYNHIQAFILKHLFTSHSKISGGMIRMVLCF